MPAPSPGGRPGRGARGRFIWRSTPGWGARACVGTRSPACVTPSIRPPSRVATPSSIRPTVATLGIGYADGLRRSLGLSGRGAVLLRGRRCPIIGAVTMDLCMVEVEELRVQVGDVATLIGAAEGGERGEGGGGAITLEEFAGWAGELQRAVLTSLGPRLPRIYDGSAQP